MTYQRVDRSRLTTVVPVTGEVDHVTALGIPAAVRAALSDGARHIVVDLTDVDFMDASALSALVLSRKLADLSGAHLSVRCAAARHVRLFTITGLECLLDGR